MIVSPKALRSFLNRDTDSWVWMKKLPDQELDDEILELPEKFKFKTTPFKHQKVCLALGTAFDSFMFLLDMGLGKTKLSLDCFGIRKAENRAKRALVVVPSASNIEGWREEVATHTNFTMTGLYGTRDQRFKLAQEETDVHVINYAGLIVMMTKFVKDTKKQKKKREPVEELCEQFVTKYDMVIFDEIHYCKNPDSLITLLCDILCMNVPFRYGLTGTAMAEPKDLWSQFYLIDRGETFGDNYEMFLYCFYKKVRNPFGAEWVFDNKKTRTLARMIKHRSIEYSDRECNDLPRNIKVKRPLILPPENRRHYEQALNGIIEADGDSREIKSNYIKARQILSGYLIIPPDEEDELSEETIIHFANNPRLELLMDLVDNMPHTSKMLVFYEYIETGNIINQALKEAKINFRRLDGATKNSQKVVKDFKTDPSIHVLIANVKSGGTGHNFQVSNYTFFYETPSSPILRKQSVKRNYRTKQSKVTYHYDAVYKGTLDETIQANLKNNIDLFDAIIKGGNVKTLFKR